jgi:exo-1,4-beta-D-glucosaminidase
MVKAIRLQVRILLILFLVICSDVIYAQKKFSSNELVLNKGWFIQASEKVTDVGSLIATQNYSMHNWYGAEVPSTVMGTLVKDSVYKNVFVDDNLNKIPTGQFEKSWWYRNEFVLPEGNHGNTIKLKFEGIIYRGNIWFNGIQIGGCDSIAGVYRMFEFDVSKIIKPKEKNVLAVEVFPRITVWEFGAKSN